MLRIRFDELPADVVKTIEQTKDLKQLNAWLDRFATATTLADVGIGQTKD